MRMRIGENLERCEETKNEKELREGRKARLVDRRYGR